MPTAAPPNPPTAEPAPQPAPEFAIRPPQGRQRRDRWFLRVCQLTAVFAVLLLAFLLPPPPRASARP